MLAAREIGAAVSALFAYLTTVLPRVRRELRGLGPLSPEKARNAEAVAVFATLAPRARRATVVRAMVALQVAIDLRDELEEAGAGSASDPRVDRLEARWRQLVAALPAQETVRPILERAVERCKQGQLHTHRAQLEGVEQLRLWGGQLSAPTGYRWWEVAAAASSSVAAHALIAAAADPNTNSSGAVAIDAAYHPPVGALTVLLDDLVDREHDRATGNHNYLEYYDSPAEAVQRLAVIAGNGEEAISSLPHRPRHRAILAGVAGYYLSESGLENTLIAARLRTTLGPPVRLLAFFVSARRRLRQISGMGA